MNLFQKYLVEEFAEDYQEGYLSRREALKLISSVTGSMLMATSILAACGAPPETQEATATRQPGAAANTAAPTGTNKVTGTAEATGTPAPTNSAEPPATETGPSASATESSSGTNGPAIESGDIEFSGEGVTLLGTLSRPADGGPHPVILVCHENRGLTEHIKDVTRRLAREGYVALAVDLLSRSGGSRSMSEGDVPGALSRLTAEQHVQDFVSGWRYLQGQAFAKAERVGMTGFCYGGGVTWQVATKIPELLAAVPFYGPHPEVSEVPNIQAAVLGIYAGNDQRINQGIPAIEEAMKANGKIYEKVIYPGVEHAFHNDTTTRYNAEAAQDAWRRMLEWFGRYVK